MPPTSKVRFSSEESIMKKWYQKDIHGDVFLRSKKGTMEGAGLSKRHISPPTMKERLTKVTEQVRDIPTQARRLQHELKIYNGGRIATISLRNKNCDAEFPEQQKNHHLYQRGEITKWSRKSQMRFKVALAKLKQEEMKNGLECTLTYPKEFPDADEHKTYKRHLARLNQILARRGFSGAWKLEFQSRGAPHYHLILLPKEKLKGLKEFRKEIAEHWYRIVGSNDEKHLRAGTEVSPIESSTGIIGYMASYMAKEDQTLPNNFTGRYWGFINKPNLPFSEETTIPLGKENAIKIRRIFRKKIEKDMRNYQMRIMGKILERETSLKMTSQELTSSLFRLGAKSPNTSKDRKLQDALKRGWVKIPKKWRVRNNQTIRLFCDPEVIKGHLISLFAREKRNLKNSGFLP